VVRDKTIQLTADGKATLEAERRTLRDEHLPDLERRIHDLSEFGDITDNGEFDDLKEEHVTTGARIAELDYVLARAVILEPDAADGVVRLGTRVTLRADDGEEEAWLLVSPQEANRSRGSISTDSPVGKAVLGCREGEAATVTTPRGSITYQVVGVA